MHTDNGWVGFDWTAQITRTSPAFAAVADDASPGLLRERASGGEPAAMRGVVVLARPEPDWVQVATWFAGSRSNWADITWSHLADRVAALGARAEDGESFDHREDMRRIVTFERAACASWVPAELVVDGARVPASHATAGAFELIAAQTSNDTMVSVTRPATSDPVPQLVWRTDWHALLRSA